jgi:hypothetical protein
VDSCIASTHLFHLRTYRDAAASLFGDRPRLARVEGLRFSRLVFVGGRFSEGFTIGTVDPRRQLALCLWEDAAALERFERGSPIARRWREASDQYCELRMRPFSTHGSYCGERPLAGLGSQRPCEGPVALWTFARIPPRSLYYFWTRIRAASVRLFSSPGLVAGTAGPERLYRGAMTFTVWESLEHALDFAYRAQPHKRIVGDVRKRGLLTDSMFIRFAIETAAGEWPSRSRFADRFDDFVRGPLSARPRC